MSHLPFRVGFKKVLDRAVSPQDMIKSWKIIRGDTVEITAGIDKGTRGTVLEVHRRWNTMLVSGCRLNKKRAPGPNGEKSYLYELESPVHYAHVHLIDPSDNSPCAATFKYDDKGKRVRVSERTNTIIPKPKQGRRDMDNKWQDYKEGPKDTQNAELLLRTYFPQSVKTFREEIKFVSAKAEEFFYPPKHLRHMKRDRNRYPKVTSHPTYTEISNYNARHNMENFEKEYEETIAGIEGLKAKDLDEYEKKLIRDAALEKQVSLGQLQSRDQDKPQE